MATYVRDRSGSLQRVGLQKRTGGGYQRTVGSGGLSNQKGSINIQAQVAERQQAQQAYKKSQAEYEAATATREEEQAVASTVGSDGQASVIKQKVFFGPSSTIIDGQGGATINELRSNKGEVIPIAGRNQTPTKIIGTSSIQPQTFQEKLASVKGQSSFSDSPLPLILSQKPTSLGEVTQSGINQFKSFGAGFALGGLQTLSFGKQLVTKPVSTGKMVASSVYTTVRNPKPFIMSQYIQAKTNPSGYGGTLAFDFALGKGLEKGFSFAGNTAKYAGKPRVEAKEIVAPSYLSGEEFYPTGSPRSAVRAVNREQRAFSASPTAPNKGNSFTVLTQAEKRAKGLDLSETGGLYAAPRVSPAFTTVVTKVEGYNTFSLIPRWGSPGAIAEIETRATRLPQSVRSQMRKEKSIRAGNVFLDEGGLSRGTNKAYSTPATELGIKPESEVIIPGKSVIKRSNEYTVFDRALGRDFEYYVDIPKTPGSKKTTRVAVRQYKNIGFEGGDVFPKNNKFGSGVTRASDIDYYSSGRSSSSGFLKFLPRINSYGGSSKSSYAGSSSGLSSFSSGSYSSSKNVVSSYSGGSKSSYAGSSSGLFSKSSGSYNRYSSGIMSSGSSAFSYSLEYTPKPPPIKLFNFEGDERIKKKKGKSFTQKKQISIYDSSLTARSFGIKARSKKATGYTGLEIRGI